MGAAQDRERSRTDSISSVLSLGDYDPNQNGAVAALDRNALKTRRTFAERAVSPLTAGGVRQSMITLVQTSLGGGVFALAYAMRLSGLGLGLFMLFFLAAVAFMGMDVMMRCAVKLQAYDTATLLAKCVGRWSAPAMDFLLVIYGNGALIAYFVLLGDFLPGILADVGYAAWPTTPALRRHCILAVMLVVVPMCLPSKLSALRYMSPVALLSITFTACVVLAKAPGNFHEHFGQPGFGRVEWCILDLGFFKSFSVLLFSFNCHLNVVPVASELQSPSDARISKINLRVVAVEVVFYALISAGGYLSFFAATAPNILTNYGTSGVITACRALLSLTILVGIPTNMLPTVRSLQGVLVKEAAPAKAEPLLAANEEIPESPRAAEGRKREALRLALTALCLAVDVAVAIAVPNVADVMGFLGASVGTVLMMVLPAVVLLKARPESFSRARVIFTASCLLGCSALSCGAIVVMLL